jgi:divalent metal cation (Fe/Co/Zn/Cd) transporter
MKNIALPIELTALHWILAFAGAAIYILLKIQENKANKDYKFGDYMKKNWASTIATVIMIPVLLLILADDFADVLPVNNITATLIGYQTNSLFRSVMTAGANKFIKKEEKTEEKGEPTP